MVYQKQLMMYPNNKRNKKMTTRDNKEIPLLPWPRQFLRRLRSRRLDSDLEDSELDLEEAELDLEEAELDLEEAEQALDLEEP